MNTKVQAAPNRSIRTTRKHYVNNRDFLIALIEYRRMTAEAETMNTPLPRVPEYIGECLKNIAEKLSHKQNFVNYSFRQEMISDGIENCFVYLNNFDPDKSSNPFAYFTQIIKFAFIRRIQREKKQMYIRCKISESQIYSNTRRANSNDMDHHIVDDFIQQYEIMLSGKRDKAKQRLKASKQAVDIIA